MSRDPLNAAILQSAAAGMASDLRNLLRHQAAPDTLDAALHAAAFTGDVVCVQLLVAANADVNALEPVGRASPLCVAAALGHADVIYTLLTLGASLDRADSSGATVLHAASSTGSHECVKLLLAAGANPRALNGQMQTALQMAETAMEATEATFPWCGPQDKLYILLLAKRVAAELGEEEDDEEGEWVDVEEDEASSSRPVKTIRKGRLNKRMAS